MFLGPPLYCCANCFQHQWLKEYVRENSRDKGDCDYCDSTNVRLVSVVNLSDAFRNMLSVYQIAESYEAGEMIYVLVQEDWGVFNVDVCRDPEKLLEDIVNSTWDDDSGETQLNANELYERKSSHWSHTTMADAWDDFCDKVRTAPDASPRFHEMLSEDIWSKEGILEQGKIFFRAREGYKVNSAEGKHPYSFNEIGAPPPEKARAGRANYQGQPVFYLADVEKTALAEIRPARGYIISLGRIQMTRDVRILDLRQPIDAPNPFVTESLEYWLEFSELLNAFGWILSKPLEFSDDQATYLPSQKLCEYVKKRGFEGILYPSALHEGGTNLVLFNPTLGGFLDSRLIEITGTEIEWEDYLYS